MSDYEALVRALREHSKPEGCDCNVCPYYDAEERGYSTCSEELTEKAADAIDELSKLQAVTSKLTGSAWRIGFQNVSRERR